MKRTIALTVALSVLILALSSCAFMKRLIEALNEEYAGTDETAATQPSTDITPSTETETASHKHNVVSIPGKAATCTEDGLTDGEICSECGEILIAQEAIPALGHDPVENPETYVSPEWDKDGHTPDTVCARCGIVYNEGTTIPRAYARIVETFFRCVLQADADPLPLESAAGLPLSEVCDFVFALAPHYGYDITAFYLGPNENDIDSYACSKASFDEMTQMMFGCTFDGLPTYSVSSGTVSWLDETGPYGAPDYVFRPVKYELTRGQVIVHLNYVRVDTATGADTVVGEYVMHAESNGQTMLIRSVTQE